MVLQQNTDRQAAIIRFITEARRRHSDLVELRRNDRAWRGLVSKVQSVFWDQPRWRLQRIGDEVLDFLYPNGNIGDRVDAIELRPGVAYCLRRFHVLIAELVRDAWVQYIRKVNTTAVGSTTDLAEFLFGSDRTDLSALRPH